MPTERSKQKMHLIQERWDKATAEYLAEHGQFPLCQCGCGKEVELGKQSLKPNLYVNYHHPKNFDKAHATKRSRLMDMGPFREELRAIKTQRAWTLEEMAEAGGVGANHFKSVMYSSRNRVTQEWAEALLERLRAAPDPTSLPTPCHGQIDQLFCPDELVGVRRTDWYNKTKKKFCRRCPIVSKCLEDNLSEPYGVFGNTSPKEREVLIRERKRAG